jgi:hypothetical protein
MLKKAIVMLAAALGTGCAPTTQVMDTGNGTFMISGRAPAMAGGTVGATRLAYDAANKYCAERSPGTHAIVIGQNERDIHQSSVFAGSGGAFGSSSAAGTSSIRFRCDT